MQVACHVMEVYSVYLIVWYRLYGERVLLNVSGVVLGRMPEGRVK